jgi:hypothetical protein
MASQAKEDLGMTSTDPAHLSKRAPAGHSARSPRQLMQVLNWGPGLAEPSALRWTANIEAVVGAILVLLSGLIHLKLYGSYKGISVIGPLFLAQGIVGIVLAVALGAFRRLWLLLAGAGFCIATAAGLLISVNFGLFGFQDSLSVPYATSSLIEEFLGGGVLLTASVLVFVAGWQARRRGGERVWPRSS